MSLGQGLGLHESITKLVETLTPKEMKPQEGVFLAFPISQISWLDEGLKRAFGAYLVLVPTSPLNGAPSMIQENHCGDYVRDMALHASGALIPSPLQEVVPTTPYRPPVGVLIQYWARDETPERNAHHG